MENTAEHLEHADHARHHAHNPFDRKVAMTMAIVAAALAGVSLLSHRAHNETLRLQGEANRIKTEVAAARVEKSNAFAWYQSKRNRQAMNESNIAMLTHLAPSDVAYPGERDKAIKAWKDQIAEYKKELKDIKAQGDAAGKLAEKLENEAKEKQDQGTHVHHQADRLDLAHLGVELGLVLCSIAVLTKRRAFWYSGIVASLVGAVLVAWAFSLQPHHDSHAPDNNHAPTEQHSGGGGH